jgi:hypothetical protein
MSTLKYRKKRKKKQKNKRNNVKKKEIKSCCLLLELARTSWLNSTLYGYLHKQIVLGGGLLTKHMEQQ